MTEGICKKCGKKIPIPDEIGQFSCMYCGKRLTKADILTGAASDPVKAESLFASAMERIAGCVLDQRGIVNEFTREDYAASFKRYMKGCFRVFDDLNSAAVLNPDKRTEYVRAAADRLISDLEVNWQSDPQWKSKKGRKALIDGDKLVIALYLVPMIGKLGFSIADEFNTYLQSQWMEKYPKSPFYIGDYDKITDSYYSRLKCWITAAVCRSQGKPDNCDELNALRRFRDGWLSQTEQGRELIREYYRAAPRLTACMEVTGFDCEGLYKMYILPCVEDIRAGRYESCRDRYVEMVTELGSRYPMLKV